MRREPAAEVGPSQVGRAIGRGAFHDLRKKTQLAQLRRKRFGIEHGVHRVARPCMRETEAQEFGGGQPAPRPPERNARGRVGAQRRPVVTNNSRARQVNPAGVALPP